MKSHCLIFYFFFASCAQQIFVVQALLLASYLPKLSCDVPSLKEREHLNNLVPFNW